MVCSKPKARSKSKSKPKSKPRSASRMSTKKYTSRKSPPFPANKMCGSVKKGNDGNMYKSKRGSNGVCRWIAVSAAVRSKSR